MKAFDHRPDGVTTTIEIDADGNTIVGTHQHVTPLLDHMNDRSNDGTAGWTPSRNMRLKASIPEAVYDEWLREAHREGIPIYHRRVRDEFIKRKLVDLKRLTVEGRAQDRVGYEPLRA